MKKAVSTMILGLAALQGTAFADTIPTTPEIPSGFAPFLLVGGLGLVLYLRRFFK